MSGDGEVGLRAFERKDLEWLVDRHGAHYAASDGFGARFPALVRQVAEAFLDRAKPPRERAWVAAAGARRLGTIFCVEGPEPDAAQLRLFCVEREAQGRGLGRRLLTDCLHHARGRRLRPHGALDT